MKIREVSLQNIKSFCEIQKSSFNDGLNFIIGSNGSGKSNFLEIVQSCLNDIFFQPKLSFSDENREGKYLFKVETPPIRTDTLEKNIFVSNYYSEELEKFINVQIEIERKDIETFNNFRSILGPLTDFENNKTVNNIISNLVQQFDVNLDYSDLIGKKVNLMFKGIHLSLEISDKKLLSFVNYLRYSRQIFYFINFYNSSRDDDSITPYFQSFHYFPPNREAIDISNSNDIDIMNSQSRFINSFNQREINQNSRDSSSGGLLSKLAENFFLNNGENEEFRNLLKKHLKIDFSIRKVGTKFQNKFRINFFRDEVAKQIPIRFSSGEKELFNFVAGIYLHDIQSGILLIDEPEIHLHPKWQKKLQDLLSDLSKVSNNQIILVTHSDHFVRSDMLSSLIRVHKEEDKSRIFTPDYSILNQQSNKDLFLLLQSANNTKVFFADKVILVEGFVDRIIFQKLVEIEQQKNKDSQVIEVIEVLGKNNFDKFSKYLATWKINHYIIADLDYLFQIGNSSIKNLFAANEKKITSKLSEKNNRDALKLISITEKLKNNITVEIMQQLFDYVDYLKSIHTSLSKDDYKNNVSEIDSFVQRKIDDNIFILKNGEIEVYFKTSKFSVETAIEAVNEITSGNKKAHRELTKIIKSIIEDGLTRISNN